MTGSLSVELLSAGDAEADSELAAFFAACPTSFAQQTPGWRDVITSLGVDEPLFLACRRSAELLGVLPAYRFEGPLGAILTSCAQAGPLGGVAILPGADARSVYRALLARFVELAAERGCAVATVISNPFWPDRELYEELLSPDFTLENVCQVLDLESALDTTGRVVGSSKNLRRNLRKAHSAGFVIDEEQSLANVEEWYAIHEARHREIGAAPLPRALFTAALTHMVPRGKARYFFVRLPGSGEMVAGGFYVCHGSVIDALMPAVHTAHANLGPNVALALHSMRWAREHGLRYYNWQPSPPDSGVYRFKRQWGSRDVAYAYYSRITGDVEPILRSSPQAIRSGYPWHYVVPFDCIGGANRSPGGVSTRSAAWSAADASGSAGR